MTQQINLIDESLRQGRDWANGVMIVSSLMIGATTVLGHGLWERVQWTHATEQVAQAESAREAGNAQMQAIAGKLAEVQAQIAADDQMRKAAAAMVDPPQNCVARFEELITGLTSTMWMESVEFRGARGVHMKVNGLQQGDLARYANGLSGSKAFVGLPVEVLNIERKSMEQAEATSGDAPRKSTPYYSFELAAMDADTFKEAAP